MVLLKNGKFKGVLERVPVVCCSKMKAVLTEDCPDLGIRKFNEIGGLHLVVVRLMQEAGEVLWRLLQYSFGNEKKTEIRSPGVEGEAELEDGYYRVK